MTHVLTLLTAAGATTAFLLQASFAHAALSSPQALCSIAKLKTAAKTFGCSLRQRTRAIGGGPVDVTSCAEKLTDRFESAESRGGCATTADAALAFSRSDTSATDVLDVLGSGLVLDDTQLKCIKKKTKLAARYATCQAAALANRLNNSFLGERDDFDACRSSHETKSAALDLAGTCPVTGESASVQEQSGRGYGFLPGASLDSANLESAALPLAYLAGAELFRAYLSGADLRGADFTNAILDQAHTHPSEFEPPANLRGATFDGATIDDSRLDFALLGGADFSSATFNFIHGAFVECPASLPADWACVSEHLVGPSANMQFYQLDGADLTGVNLSAAFLDLTHLDGAILRNVDLSGARIYYGFLDGADLAGADLGGASLQHLFGTGLVDCPASLPSNYACVKRNLIGYQSELFEADLVGADLSGIVAHDTTFGSSDMTGASMAGADLLGASFSNTVCPDGVIGDCCDHFVGGPPLRCGSP